MAKKSSSPSSAPSTSFRAKKKVSGRKSPKTRAPQKHVSTDTVTFDQPKLTEIPQLDPAIDRTSDQPAENEQNDENFHQEAKKYEPPQLVNGKQAFDESKEDPECFDELPIANATKKALDEMGLTTMTPIQRRCIPAAMAGHEILGAARTGSGKTLAFLVPVIELLVRARFTPRNGTGVIILTPTRELALQILSVVSQLLRSHSVTFSSVIGGSPRVAEAARLSRGVNLVVATPGRLLDHLQNTSSFVFRNLRALVIDEADRILEVGFEDQMRAIVKLLPRDRQTLLFSATQTTKVEELARASLRSKPVYINVEANQKETTTTSSSSTSSSETISGIADGLEQGYVVCSSEMRFRLLFTFLKRNMGKKVIVFFSSCDSVKFHGDLLNYIDIPVLELHGKKSQNKRTTTFFEFVNADRGILLCTNVAARGLDIPNVNWIVQYDPSDDPRDYIHRVGRTARAGASGKALLFLLPAELGYLRVLRNAGMMLSEYSVPASKIASVQTQLEKLVGRNHYLHNCARDAYRGYMRAYASHSLKNIFAIEKLELQKVSVAFGLKTPPNVSVSMLGLDDPTSKDDSDEERRKNPKKRVFNKNTSAGKRTKQK